MVNMTEINDNVYWLLDKIESHRTFNAVVDAIADLKIARVNDASEPEILDVLERYSDPGVDVDVAKMAIQRMYSRLHDLGANITMVFFTRRGNAPYIPFEKLTTGEGEDGLRP